MNLPFNIKMLFLNLSIYQSCIYFLNLPYYKTLTCSCLHSLHWWHLTPPNQLPSFLGLKNTPTAPRQKGLILPNEGPGYNTKPSHGEVPVMLELWGMQSNPSLPLFLGPLWPGVVVPDRTQSMSNRTELHIYVKLNYL